MTVGGQAYGGRGWCIGRMVTRTGHLAVSRVVGVAVVVVVVRMAPIVVVVVMIVVSVLVGMVVLVVVPV